GPVPNIAFKEASRSAANYMLCHRPNVIVPCAEEFLPTCSRTTSSFLPRTKSGGNSSAELCEAADGVVKRILQVFRERWLYGLRPEPKKMMRGDGFCPVECLCPRDSKIGPAGALPPERRSGPAEVKRSELKLHHEIELTWGCAEGGVEDL